MEHGDGGARESRERSNVRLVESNRRDAWYQIWLENLLSSQIFRTQLTVSALVFGNVATVAAKSKFIFASHFCLTIAMQ
jgi:hypothetical protein